ncbi:MAG: ribulose-phosphate 3-epimerase [Lachnospiraceae bacterium]|nr:ribulose-phosphate 3-epimerase [Lachnospiraceae bacterium]
MDLCNLENTVRKVEALGVEMLHIDLVDGYFSPSMPIGLDVIRQLRKKTQLPFDAHVMVEDCRFFLDELLDIGAQRIAIHSESCVHPDRILAEIQSAGVEAGLAISPGTSLDVLDYLKDRCDYVLHMMINPGFASVPNETVVPYGMKKLRDIRNKIGTEKDITVDGHVSFELLPDLVKAGATTFVAGTKSLFSNRGSCEENMSEIQKIFHSQEKEGDYEF